ncbi:hypothetical protein NU195Hw_g4107t1 [Hortaea werneckii]
MSSTNIPASDGSYFENQRALLVNDVAASLENVLQNINKLNRSLEGVIAVRLPDAMHFYCHWSLYRHRSLAVGNEFSQVEGLWSQFENVMAKQPEPAEKQQEEQRDAEGGATETPKR